MGLDTERVRSSLNARHACGRLRDGDPYPIDEELDSAFLDLRDRRTGKARVRLPGLVHALRVTPAKCKVEDQVLLVVERPRSVAFDRCPGCAVDFAIVNCEHDV